jgi:hypothetical protein
MEGIMIRAKQYSGNKRCNIDNDPFKVLRPNHILTILASVS